MSFVMWSNRLNFQKITLHEETSDKKEHDEYHAHVWQLDIMIWKMSNCGLQFTEMGPQSPINKDISLV